MSPRISLTIHRSQLAELLQSPRTQAAEALAAARARGVRIRRSEVGVVCGLVEWRVDHHLTPAGVSLAGAVLLALQPEPQEGEEPLAAAARALGASLAWMEGAEAGWAGELMDTRWIAGLDGELYLDGHEAGVALWALFGGRR